VLKKGGRLSSTGSQHCLLDVKTKCVAPDELANRAVQSCAIIKHTPTHQISTTQHLLFCVQNAQCCTMFHNVVKFWPWKATAWKDCPTLSNSVHFAKHFDEMGYNRILAIEGADHSSPKKWLITHCPITLVETESQIHQKHVWRARICVPSNYLCRWGFSNLPSTSGFPVCTPAGLVSWHLFVFRTYDHVTLGW